MTLMKSVSNKVILDSKESNTLAQRSPRKKSPRFEPAYTRPISSKEKPRHVNIKMDAELKNYQ